MRDVIHKFCRLQHHSEVETEAEYFLGANEVQTASKKDEGDRDNTIIKGD